MTAEEEVKELKLTIVKLRVCIDDQQKEIKRLESYELKNKKLEDKIQEERDLNHNLEKVICDMSKEVIKNIKGLYGIKNTIMNEFFLGKE